MAASLRFYRALAPNASTQTESSMWTELDLDGATLALHGVDEAPSHTDSAVAIAFNSNDPLEEVADRLAAAGYPAGEIVAQPFGRSITVTDPNGLRVQINEHPAA